MPSIKKVRRAAKKANKFEDQFRKARKAKDINRLSTLLEKAEDFDSSPLGVGGKAKFLTKVQKARNARTRFRGQLRPLVKEFSRQALLRRGTSNRQRLSGTAVGPATGSNLAPSVATTGTTLLRVQGRKPI